MSPLAIILFVWAIVLSEVSVAAALAFAGCGTIVQLMLLAGVGLNDGPENPDQFE